jgi:GT2 family glycosyltransferase
MSEPSTNPSAIRADGDADGDGDGQMDLSRLSVSVAIAAYTEDRWVLLERSVQSVATQTLAPQLVVLCIDNNPALLARCRARWPKTLDGSETPITVIPDEHTAHLAGREEHERVHGSARRFGAGSVRTTALRACRSEIVAFLDDDAEAEPKWLENLIAPYVDPTVVAVGGAPLPRYETARPRWFPPEFDWVFGCAYIGMPTECAPIRHLIGANMSARRTALLRVGGFKSIDFDDMDMSHRLAGAYPTSQILYAPAARVLHFVSRDRVSWTYFWRRCLHVNRHKVRAFAGLGDAANLDSERDFVVRIWTRQQLKHLRDLFRGDVFAAGRLLASCVGLSLAGLGNVIGRIENRIRPNPNV